jgi:NAD(P)-dependent dehydrogenase (short-subunit alcohol dehydrogenase family)
MKSFQQKVAVITGAGSGIGRALAFELAKEGARLAISDVNEAGLQQTADACRSTGALVLATKTNVAELAEVQALVKAVLDEFGQVDLVFNNAGIALGKKPLTALSYEEWDKIMGVNLWGVIYGSKEFLPHLQQRPEGVIVNISSVFGLAGIAEQVPYCTTKFAVRGFTEALRMELLGSNVEVYCVHPGGINTNIANLAADEAANDPKKKQEVDNFKKMLIHSPEKAAKTILSAVKAKNEKILIGQEAYLFDFATRLLPVNYSKVMNYGMKRLLKV